MDDQKLIMINVFLSFISVGISFIGLCLATKVGGAIMSDVVGKTRAGRVRNREKNNTKLMRKRTGLPAKLELSCDVPMGND